MIPSPTYASFIPIRDWTKNIPSAMAKMPTSTPTSRRRNRIRASR